MPKGGGNRGKGKCAQWILANVSYQGDECLIWPFAGTHNGYGSLGYMGRMYRAHRLMCELVNGPPPSKHHQAAHSCGKGRFGCCTPKHLSWKTHEENQADKTLHGTGKVPKPKKLTREDVSFIRSSKGTIPQMKLAAMFGVTHSCIEFWQSHDREPVRMRSARGAAHE